MADELGLLMTLSGHSGIIEKPILLLILRLWAVGTRVRKVPAQPTGTESKLFFKTHTPAGQ